MLGIKRACEGVILRFRKLDPIITSAWNIAGSIADVAMNIKEYITSF